MKVFEARAHGRSSLPHSAPAKTTAYLGKGQTLMARVIGEYADNLDSQLHQLRIRDHGASVARQRRGESSPCCTTLRDRQLIALYGQQVQLLASNERLLSVIQKCIIRVVVR